MAALPIPLVLDAPPYLVHQKVVRTDAASLPLVLELLARLESHSHRNVVQVYSHQERSDGVLVRSEFCPGGTLRDFLDYSKARGQPLQTGTVIKFAREMLSGLGFLHELGITHANLTPETVFLGPDLQAVLGGLQLLASEASVPLGADIPVYYREEDRSSMSMDLFAVGCILHEMLTQRPLFVGNYSGPEGELEITRVPMTGYRDLPTPLVEAVVLMTNSVEAPIASASDFLLQPQYSALLALEADIPMFSLFVSEGSSASIAASMNGHAIQRCAQRKQSLGRCPVNLPRPVQLISEVPRPAVDRPSTRPPPLSAALCPDSQRAPPVAAAAPSHTAAPAPPRAPPATATNALPAKPSASSKATTPSPAAPSRPAPSSTTPSKPSKPPGGSPPARAATAASKAQPRQTGARPGKTPTPSAPPSSSKPPPPPPPKTPPSEPSVGSTPAPASHGSSTSSSSQERSSESESEPPPLPPLPEDPPSTAWSSSPSSADSLPGTPSETPQASREAFFPTQQPSSSSSSTKPSSPTSPCCSVQ